MAQRLSGGNVALALIANTLATGGILIAIILAFGPVSGGHFNPAVTVSDALQGGLSWRDAGVYVISQLIGALAGVALANLMFNEPVFFISHHERNGAGVLLGEFVATFGLLSVIWGCVRAAKPAIPYAVAAFIVAGYWFTSSTSFANPAVTIARSLSDTFTGIAPANVPGFIVAEFLGAIGATLLFGWLLPARKTG